MTKQRRSSCPVACSLDVIGDRWTLLVIRDLFAGKSRYGDFASSAEHIPTNILAERLKRLEAAGLIESTAYSQHPPRFEYHLTERGRALAPVLDAVANWGEEQFPGTQRLPRLRREPASQSAKHPPQRAEQASQAT
ncbi:MAG TPA: helix-turn-helix domain-containing protein [Chloroflexota bacterium]